jgi:ATP-dependent Lhr-like helicase
MGAVDLVIQVESPKSVARGLQRIGRAGHGVGEVSKGRIFPKFRADLLECAVVARACARGDRETRVPRNPLDVLAQQIVAIAALDEWESGRRRSARARHGARLPLAELSREQLENVLDMLDGPLPVDEFASCGRASSGTASPARSAPATARAARGHQRRHDPRPRPVRRVPARRGAASASSTRRWSTRRARPDVPARRVDLADRGDHARPRDRHARAGRARARCRSGRATRSAARSSWARRSARSRASCGLSTQAPSALERDYDLDPRAARNLLAYLREQQARRPAWCPSDRTIVVERFRDEIGDWRLCILTPFGGRVHAPGRWRSRADPRARSASRPTRSGPTTASSLHLPDADEPPGAELC